MYFSSKGINTQSTKIKPGYLFSNSRKLQEYFGFVPLHPFCAPRVGA